MNPAYIILCFWFNQSATRTGPWGTEHGRKTEAMTIKAVLPAACVLTAGGYSFPAGCFSKDRISIKANNYKDSNQKDLRPKKKMKTANTLVTSVHSLIQAFRPAADAHHLDLSTFPFGLPYYKLHHPTIPSFFLSIYVLSAFPHRECSGKLQRSIQIFLL